MALSSGGNAAERPAAVPPAPPIAQLTLDWPALAERLVQHLALVPGERVLSLCAGDRFQREFEPHLRYAVMKAGGVDLGCLGVLAEPLPQSFDPQVIQRGAAPAREALRAVLRDVDAGVMLLVDREVELPCGVLRVAPLEESVGGVIAYPVTQWDGRPVEGSSSISRRAA